jgi:HSP20 family protein
MTTRRARPPITFVLGLKPSHPLSENTPLPLAPVDVVEHDAGWSLVYDLAGADPARLQVEVKGRVVTIRGERSATEVGRGRFLRVERAVGPFERAIELPEEPDPEGGEASFADGLLRLELKRRTPARREIVITRGSERAQ